ncbi:MAG: hypothetical protein PWR07_2237 [Bacillota bacterium]|nr:hypothetical protein [Bacillota bacterium]
MSISANMVASAGMNADTNTSVGSRSLLQNAS